MPNADAKSQLTFFAETQSELRAKKGIGILDATLISIGFTTSNLQHIVTPVTAGGLGIGLGSLAGAVATIAILGVATIAIAGLISYSVLKIIDKNAQQGLLLQEKEVEWKERQIMFYARLLYLRHLLKLSENNSLPYFHRVLRTDLGLDNQTAAELAVSVDSLYREERGFYRVFLQRDPGVISEEKAIQQYISENAEHYMPRIQQGLRYLDIEHPVHKKNWKPELIGAFAGFITFVSMSSGFLGAYSSVLTLALSISALSLAVPVLGWIIFATSLFFALGIGLTVRQYTDKSIKCQEMMDDIDNQKSILADGLVKVHEVEMRLLTEKLSRTERPVADFKTNAARPSLPRSRSWASGFFRQSVAPTQEPEHKSSQEPVASLTVL